VIHGVIRLSILLKCAAQHVLGYPKLQVVIFIDILRPEICHNIRGICEMVLFKCYLLIQTTLGDFY